MENGAHQYLAAILAALAAGMGTLLASDEKLTWRLAIGRALSSGALGVAAGSVLLWIPNAPWFAVVGVAAVLGSIGTSGLERILQMTKRG